MLYFNRTINSVALFSGLCRACLAALSPKPMETSPEHRTGLSILAATEIAIRGSPQENKNKRTEVTFFNPGRAAAAEIFGSRGSKRLQVSEGAGSATSHLHSLWHFF